MRDREEQSGSNATYPSLFEDSRGSEMSYKHMYIPESSIYDEQVPLKHKRDLHLSQRSITVFGYSATSVECVLRRFKTFGEIKDINYGKNWMDIKYDQEKQMFRALKENGTILNEEMIGVMQKNRKDVGSLRYGDDNVFAKPEEGILVRIFAYLFGK
ncbi:hypothetical protein NEDG_00076 [Nematocida displodere]|uniref:RRM Nup35-type domain-containing protein n=1 Tax=Nematocida displodere TaxID=1805483 RepID=A0A177EJF4_9MICR|nr:hypothetical protein NEDG_00076 [Nematocida displodere]